MRKSGMIFITTVHIFIEFIAVSVLSVIGLNAFFIPVTKCYWWRQWEVTLLRLFNLQCIVIIIIVIALQPFGGPWLLFSFLVLYTVGRIPRTAISPSQGLDLRTEQHRHRINTDINASRVIQTHCHSISGEDSLHLKPRGHCDRYLNV
jgi:hypothetical protein